MLNRLEQFLCLVILNDKKQIRILAVPKEPLKLYTKIYLGPFCFMIFRSFNQTRMSASNAKRQVQVGAHNLEPYNY